MQDNREYDQMFPTDKIPQGQDVAQICLNGHEVNAAYNSCPHFNQDNCSKCGERTITSCEECNVEIRGHLWRSYSIYIPPKYCHKCGAAYPWTEKILENAKAMIRLEPNLKQQDKDTLSAILPDLLKETPKSKLAILHLKRFGKKIRPALYKILIGAASAVMKKLIEDAIKGDMSG